MIGTVETQSYKRCLCLVYLHHFHFQLVYHQTYFWRALPIPAARSAFLGFPFRDVPWLLGIVFRFDYFCSCPASVASSNDIDDVYRLPRLWLLKV